MCILMRQERNKAPSRKILLLYAIFLAWLIRISVMVVVFLHAKNELVLIWCGVPVGLEGGPVRFVGKTKAWRGGNDGHDRLGRGVGRVPGRVGDWRGVV